MSTIPFSQVVNVIPSVLTAGGNAVDLNGLVLTQSSYAPYGQVLSFSTSTAVASYFGATSTEALMAAQYFNGYTGCTNLPGQMLFSRYPETAIAGFLRSASLASLTLTQLQALSGVLTITVAGTPFTSSTINLSSATSFSNAATIIQAAFTSPTFTVTFDSTTNAFIFTTNTTGSVETITYCTGSLSAGLFLTQATGAVLSQGAAAGTASAFMNTILTLNQNWATFTTTWEPLDTEKETFATWANSVQPRFLYVVYDSNAVIASTPNATGTFNAWVVTNSIIGVLPIYYNLSIAPGYLVAASVMGYAASLNFQRTNGRTDLCFRNFPGVTPSVTDVVTQGNVTSNGYNFYGYFGSNNPANNSAWFSPGGVSGTWKWADTYLNQIWLNANIQLSIVQLLLNTPNIPYNAQGYALVANAPVGIINQAVAFGAIRAGVTLSSSQAAQIKLAAGGVDPTAQLFSQGWYLQVLPASPTVRAARASPPCTFWYLDGQSVQSIVLASIEVQ